MGQFSVLRKVIFTGNLLVDLLTVTGMLCALYGAALIHIGLVWGLIGLLIVKIGTLQHVTYVRMKALESLAAASKDGALSHPKSNMEEVKSEGSNSGQYL